MLRIENRFGFGLRVVDALESVETNSCGTEVVDELMNAFAKVRSDERAKTVEMVEGWL